MPPRAAPRLVPRPIRVTIPRPNIQGRLRHPSGQRPSPRWNGKACALPGTGAGTAALRQQAFLVCWPMASKNASRRVFTSGNFFTVTLIFRLPGSLLFLFAPAGGFRKTLFYKPSSHMHAQKKRYFQGEKLRATVKKKGSNPCW